MRVQTGEILREQPFIELDVSSCAPVSRNIGTLPDPDCSSCVQASSYMWSSIMGSSCTIASSTPIWCVAALLLMCRRHHSRTPSRCDGCVPRSSAALTCVAFLLFCVCQPPLSVQVRPL